MGTSDEVCKRSSVRKAAPETRAIRQQVGSVHKILFTPPLCRTLQLANNSQSMLKNLKTRCQVSVFVLLTSVFLGGNDGLALVCDGCAGV